MKRMKKTVASILTAVVALSAVGFAGCSEEKQGAVIPAPQTQESTIQNGGVSSRPMVNDEVYGEPYTGQIVRCGGTYELSSNIAFLSEELTEQAENGEDLTVNLTCTVTPADAKQDVKWAVAFVNPDSEWASGKNVSDYVTVTPTAENGTAVTVTCKEAFSEQIKLTVTSLWDETKTVECIVDFVSAYKNVTLTFGEDAVNLGGVTDVWWETCETANAGVAWGGDVGVNITTEENGTVTGYTYRVDVYSPNYFYFGDTSGFGSSDGYLVIDGYDFYLSHSSNGGMSNVNNITFKYYNTLFVQGFYIERGLKDFDLPQQGETVTIDEGSLCTVLLTVTSPSGTEMQYMSLLNLTEFTYTPPVETLSLSTSKIKVTYEP